MKTTFIALCAAVALSACSKREEPPTAMGTGAAPPATAPVDGAPPTPAAAVLLAPTQGNTASGSLAVSAEAGSVRLAGSLQGLAPDAEFGFHIHEKGDCSAPDASSAGGHFNPSNAAHGDPQGSAHHAGDMLNVKSDAQGVAQVDVQASGVTLNGGQPTDVLGKAVVLHEKADDYASQPAGNSGARIACGVITG
jgi:Cu-Zn family superoxide dismutase